MITLNIIVMGLCIAVFGFIDGHMISISRKEHHPVFFALFVVIGVLLCILVGYLGYATSKLVKS